MQKSKIITTIILAFTPILLTINVDGKAPPLKYQMMSDSLHVDWTLGRPILVNWDDGRQASLLVARHPSNVFEQPFEVHENLCKETAKVRCSIFSNIKVDQLKLVWTNNPDREKVGRIVKMRTTTGEILDMNGYIAYSYSNRHVMGPQKEGFFFKIKCDDYSWLPGGHGKRPPAELIVHHWASEQVTINFELGVQENLISRGGINLLFKKSDEDELSLEKADYWYVDGVNVTSTMVGPHMGASSTLSIKRNKEGENCQIVLRPQFEKIKREFYSYIQGLPNNYQPYIHGQEDLLNYTLLPANLSMNQKINLIKMANEFF